MNQSVPELNLFSAVDSSINKCPNLSDLWSLEVIGINDPAQLGDDDEALAQLNNTIYYDGERYQIAWPWRSSEFTLLENYGVAYGGVKSLSRRFQADRVTLRQYDDILRSQLRQGIIEKVPETEMKTNCKRHYLPHHPVVTPSKSIRIVYDASAKEDRDVA